MNDQKRLIEAIELPPGITREQARVMGEIAFQAHRATKSPQLRKAVEQAIENPPPRQEVTVRTISDRQAPIDEGEWEFRLSGGVLEVIAWNDAKTEAQVVHFVRRGMQIHQMHTHPAEGEQPQE